MLPPPDAHGHAALLLVESLLHRLVERSVISTDEAIDILETADSVQVEIAEAADVAGSPMWRSHALLSFIAGSFRHDSDGGSQAAHRHQAGGRRSPGATATLVRRSGRVTHR